MLCDYKLLLVRQPFLFATIPFPFADAGDPLSFTPCDAIHLNTRFFIRQPSCHLVPGETWPWGGAERPETDLFKLATQSMYLFLSGEQGYSHDCQSVSALEKTLAISCVTYMSRVAHIFAVDVTELARHQP